MAMNIFRLTGDLCHIISIAIFVHVVCWKKNASCVSLKSQVLYLLVFTTRYLDLFTVFLSFYNSFLKLIYIASTAGIIYVIKVVEPTKSTYSSTQDEFDILKYSIAPSALLALMINAFTIDSYYFDGLKLLWTYSIIQEATAMVPQLRIAYYNRHIQSEIKLAILFMGLYRFFYILNWIYRANTEANYKHNWLVYICGVLQVAIYSDFFYHAGTTIYNNCRAVGNDAPPIVSSDNELSDPLLTERATATETEISVVTSDVATGISDDQCKIDAALITKPNGNQDIPIVQIV